MPLLHRPLQGCTLTRIPKESPAVTNGGSPGRAAVEARRGRGGIGAARREQRRAVEGSSPDG
eukprot:1409033-Pyramimonas_sp.AAC.1